MVSARLEGLEGEARRLLRAASVFGEVFWKGGVVTLLGGLIRAAQVESWLLALVEREVIVRRVGSRFPGEREYAFRHALLREGAYAMLTEADRALGHRLAAGWLERAGEGDPMLLAEHFERGGDAARAGVYYLRAAEQANRGHDMEAARARAERGLVDEVAPDVRVGLLGVLCEVHAWRSQWSEGAAYADEVLRLATPGTGPWLRATMLIKFGYAVRHAGDFVLEVADLDAPPLRERLARIPPRTRSAPTPRRSVEASSVLDYIGPIRRSRTRIATSELRAVVAPDAPGSAPSSRAGGSTPDGDPPPLATWIEEDPLARAADAAEASREAFREALALRARRDARAGVHRHEPLVPGRARRRAERELRGADMVDQGFGISAWRCGGSGWPACSPIGASSSRPAPSPSGDEWSSFRANGAGRRGRAAAAGRSAEVLLSLGGPRGRRSGRRARRSSCSRSSRSIALP